MSAYSVINLDSTSSKGRRSPVEFEVAGRGSFRCAGVRGLKALRGGLLSGGILKEPLQRPVDVGARQTRTVGRASDTLPVFVLMSRVVLALMGLLLVLMPWSEQYSMLDNFPHGQDTEVGLLVLLMGLGLALLFAQARTTAIRAWLMITVIFLRIARLVKLRPLFWTREAGGGGLLSSEIPISPPGAFTVPLQI